MFLDSSSRNAAPIQNRSANSAIRRNGPPATRTMSTDPTRISPMTSRYRFGMEGVGR